MPTVAFNICLPRDAFSRTANVERNGGHKWVKIVYHDQEAVGGACTSLLVVASEATMQKLLRGSDVANWAGHRYDIRHIGIWLFVPIFVYLKLLFSICSHKSL